MKTISRLICIVAGHKPYPLSNVPATPSPKSKNIIFSGMPCVGSFIQSKIWLQNTEGKGAPVFHLQTFPYEIKFYICSRCHQLYWKVGVQYGALCDVNRVPELEELRKMKERFVWEEKQRKNNKGVESLYKQYLMLLKLSYKEDDDEA